MPALHDVHVDPAGLSRTARRHTLPTPWRTCYLSTSHSLSLRTCGLEQPEQNSWTLCYLCVIRQMAYRDDSVQQLHNSKTVARRSKIHPGKAHMWHVLYGIAWIWSSKKLSAALGRHGGYLSFQALRSAVTDRRKEPISRRKTRKVDFQVKLKITQNSLVE